jgi:hypothetical protein
MACDATEATGLSVRTASVAMGDFGRELGSDGIEADVVGEVGVATAGSFARDTFVSMTGLIGRAEAAETAGVDGRDDVDCADAFAVAFWVTVRVDELELAVVVTEVPEREDREAPAILLAWRLLVCD